MGCLVFGLLQTELGRKFLHPLGRLGPALPAQAVGPPHSLQVKEASLVCFLRGPGRDGGGGGDAPHLRQIDASLEAAVNIGARKKNLA